jgi:GntR family transcriptional regulator / MocR family aminotransferase
MSDTRAGATPLFVMLDDTRPEPLYRQIYDSLRISILKGELGSGVRLPASRTLAKQLGVSRMTVINAYDQLFAEGYLEGRAGSGTFVASRLPEEFFRTGARLKAGKTSEERPAAAHQRLSGYGRYIEKNHKRILKNEGPTAFLPFSAWLAGDRRVSF